MNEQQKKQAGYLESAKARRMKFVEKVNVIIDRRCKELNLKPQPISVDDVCANIKEAIFEEMVVGWVRGN